MNVPLSNQEKPRSVAIMQPYFLPYIGYFQLISAVDVFIIYDNIKYTKKGWFNRNRMLQNGKDVMFSLPLKSDSDHCHVIERELAPDFNPEKLLNQIKGAYHRAPYFPTTFELLKSILEFSDKNLFHFLYHSIVKTCEHLGIKTEIKISSAIAIDHELKNQEKVLALCQALEADTYVNASGGMELYSRDAFLEKGIELKFIRSKPFEYAQFGQAFVPWLSIIDVMMFNAPDEVQRGISTHFELI